MQTEKCPPHSVLGVLLRPFETPLDETVFVVPDSEKGLPLTTGLKKNLALRGCVNPDLVYPFQFSSNTLSLGYLFSSVIGTAYTGLGIRFNLGGLSEEENRKGVAVYHYVLDEIEFVQFLNATISLAGKGLKTAENPRATIKILTGNALVLLVTLKRMQQSEVAKTFLGDFPLLTTRYGLVQFICGLWEEAWSVAYQLSDGAETAYSCAALVRACAAYYYYTEAGKSDLFKGLLGSCVANAKDRVKTVLIGYIVSRIDQSRTAAGAGLDIPWDKGDDRSTPGKYRSIVFSQLGLVTRRGRESSAPSPRHADVYQKAIEQCRANLLTSANGTILTTSELDPFAKCLQIGADWAASKDAPLYSKAAHPTACSARALWVWESATQVVPEGLLPLYEDGRKRYTPD